MKMMLVVVGMLLSVNCFADVPLSIESGYARATPPKAVNSAVFGVLKNAGDKPLVLVKAQSKVAKTVELHTAVHEDGMMKMRQISNMTIPAHGELNLQPGGLHIMLLDVQSALKEGEIVNVVLSTEQGESIDISVPVKKVSHGMSH